MAAQPHVYVIQGRTQQDYADCQAALAGVPARMTILPFLATEDEVIAKTRDADAIVVVYSPITRGVMSALEGLKTVVAQRGTVTAASPSSITVKSSDGYTITWTVVDTTQVIANRAKAEISVVSVGADVGVAGSREGDVTNARLVVVPIKR